MDERAQKGPPCFSSFSPPPPLNPFITDRHWRRRSLALLLGTFSLFAIQQASADVLVSNIDQPDSGARTAISTSAVAQGFTTGSHAESYTLEQIELSVHVARPVDPEAVQTLKGELWIADSGGGPGTKQADLTTSANLQSAGSEVVTFGAPANTVLATNTTYYLAVYMTDRRNNSRIVPTDTASEDEDSGGRSGWSIENRNYSWRSSPPSGRLSEYPNSYRIRIIGTAVELTEPTLSSDVTGNAHARLERVNRVLAPEVARATLDSSLEALRRRLIAATSGEMQVTDFADLAAGTGVWGEHEAALSGSVFTLPLGAGDRHDAPVLWGAGDWRDYSNGRHDAVDWDGKASSLHAGTDLRIGKDLLAGLMLSWSQVDLDYASRTVGNAGDGEYESRMTSLYPYLSWTGSLNLWATAGFGQGRVTIDDDTGAGHSADTDLRSVALGVRKTLVEKAEWLPESYPIRLDLRGIAWLAHFEVDGRGPIRRERADVNRVRLALEGSQMRALESGGMLVPSLELGLRHDGGDGETGTGVLAGAGLRWTEPGRSLTVEGRARALHAHGEVREWNLGGRLQLKSADRRGLELDLVPGWGAMELTSEHLWTGGAQKSATWVSKPQARLEAKLGYGLAPPAGFTQMLPYLHLSLADDAQHYRMGGHLKFGSELSLRLEGERLHAADGRTKHALMLRGDFQF